MRFWHPAAPPESARLHTILDEKVCRIALFGSAAIGFLLTPHTCLSTKECNLAISGGTVGGGNRRGTAYSLLILHFRVSVKTQNSFLAWFRNRHPDKSRMSISETSEERVPGFHENAEMQYEQGISSPLAIPASRRAARKCEKTHFFRRKSVYSGTF